MKRVEKKRLANVKLRPLPERKVLNTCQRPSNCH